VGTWPQVAAFLALAAALFPGATAQRARDAILALGARLADLGLSGDALLVRAVLPRVQGAHNAQLSSLDAMLA